MSTVPENFKDKSVCILGLGYVGLTLATVMAEAGFKVLGVEISDSILEGLHKGEPHFHEPGLVERLNHVIRRGNFHFTKHIPADCKATVYVITVGTPLGRDGKSRLDMVENISREIGKNLKEDDLVIMRSTVRLATTRKVVMPILNETGVKYDLAFCPERTLEGQALDELRKLSQIVGGITLESSVRASQIFQFITPTVVRVSDVETAEMIKLTDNAYRDVLFAYANEIARMCDAVGISTAEVITTGGLGYPRTNLHMPGPVGGPCLEKDPYILAEGVNAFGIVPEITMAARLVNERQPREVLAHLAEITRNLLGFPERPVISLMGIAFKGRPATDDLRGTMARPIFEALKHHFPSAQFRGYDPVVPLEQVKAFGVEPCSSIEGAMDGAHLVLILNNHLSFAAMPIEKLSEVLRQPALIYDFWNNFAAKHLHLAEGRWYMTLGGHGKTVLPVMERQ